MANTLILLMKGKRSKKIEIRPNAEETFTGRILEATCEVQTIIIAPSVPSFEIAPLNICPIYRGKSVLSKNT